MNDSETQFDTPKEIPGAAAWRGEELFARSDWFHELDAVELAEIDRAVQQFHSTDSSGNDLPKLALPKLAARLKRIQDSLEHGSGAVMIRGLPSERYSRAMLEQLFLGICSEIGTPISQSAAGERIFSVRDEGYAQSDPRARGPNTAKKLSFHTDRCDVIAFLCLRQAKSGGENQLVSSVSLYNEMSKRRPDLLKILLQPFLYQRHNVDQGNESAYTQQPIFSIYQGHFAANLLRVLIERAYASSETPEMTAEQREALDELERLAEDPGLHVTFAQQPGDMLFLNNWVTFHRRHEFEDHAQLELRRHLLRVWLSVPNSRPLHPLFAGNYGATQAGAIRGGMKQMKPDDGEIQ
jgi:alpha-ketoglutarate-dependent taurine dioxygenase